MHQLSFANRRTVSINFLSRAQVDLIDMSDENRETNIFPDGVVLMVYLDHFTKKAT